MLKKILLFVFLVSIAFLTGYAAAQSFFLNNSPISTATGSSQSSQVMSPSDFQNQSQELEKQKNEALSKQLQQNLSKVPPAATTPVVPPPPLPSPSTSETPETKAPAASAPAAAESSPPATASPPPPEESSSETVAPPTGPTITMPATAPASSAQVYTGFKSQNQNQNSAPGNNQNQPASSSGGWNIKY